MKRFKDELGIEYSATVAESIPRLEAVMEAYLGSRSDVMEHLDALLSADPDMPMALCFRGYSLKLAADPRFSAPLQGIVSRLAQFENHVTTREAMHISALAYWADNDLEAAARILESLLASWPKDVLALRVAHYLHFYAGDSVAMRDSVARSANVWHEHEPFYGYLLGMYSFGLEESGDYAKAEATGRRAVEINPGDAWAAHAVTHVFQMQRRYSEGVPWLSGLMPGWAGTNNFVYHLHWHQALCHIGMGELDAALAIYDDHLAGALADDFYLDVCNAATLLWRLEMLGVDVGDRWHRIHALSRQRVSDDELLFPTVHYLMAPARLQDEETLARGLANLDAWAQKDTTQGRLARTMGMTLARAIIDCGRGEFERAARSLSLIRDDIVKMGGSHAQRDIFNQLREHTGLR